MSPVATPFTDHCVVEHFGAGEARVDLDAQCFGLFTEPAAQVAQA